MVEPRQIRWSRRAKTIPTMLVASALAVIGFPFLASVAIIADVVRLRLKLPILRVYLFLLQYLINDSIEILLAPVYWAMAGFGATLGSPASIARHERLQWWSVKLLQKRAEQLLGLEIEVVEGAERSIIDGPIIAISRHVSLFDASLPSVIFQSAGFQVRGVIMAEMLADPGFDLIYARSGSVFVPRDRGAKAVAQIVKMSSSVNDDTALVIFPEGRLFTPSVRDRLLARMEKSDPARAERLSGLTNLLPPRPGGLQAMLGALPDADVVMIHHTGFERFPSIADLISVVPIDQPVTVELRRIPRAQIPVDEAKQREWLDDLWLSLDAELP